MQVTAMVCLEIKERKKNNELFKFKFLVVVSYVSNGVAHVILILET
jgi:hypothetical protein